MVLSNQLSNCFNVFVFKVGSTVLKIHEMSRGQDLNGVSASDCVYFEDFSAKFGVFLCT